MVYIIRRVLTNLFLLRRSFVLRKFCHGSKDTKMCILKIKCDEMLCTNPHSKENVIKHADV